MAPALSDESDPQNTDLYSTKIFFPQEGIINGTYYIRKSIYLS